MGGYTSKCEKSKNHCTLLPNGAPIRPALIGDVKGTEKNAQNLNWIIIHAANLVCIAY
jgi:hypothetical protein